MMCGNVIPRPMVQPACHGRIDMQGAPPPYIAYYAVMALPGGDISFREESYWAIKKPILGISTRFFAGMYI